MSLTRANIEAALVDRCAALLTLVSKDGTTVDGTNASLNYPMGKALQACGFPPADMASVADSDVNAIPLPRLGQLLDYCELYTLESIWGNWVHVDTKFGQDEQKLSQLRDGLMARIKLLEERVHKPYGQALGSARSAAITGGTIRNDPNSRTSGPWSIP